MEDDIPLDQLDDRERYWIAEKDSFHSGYNSTEGGGGIRGHKHSEESRAKIKATHLELAARGENPMQDPEVRAKNAASNSATWREKSARGEHPMQDPEYAAKAGAKIKATMLEKAARGEHPSQQPEVNAKRSATMQEKSDRGENPMQNPETAAKNAASQKSMYADPARRKQKIAKTKLTNANKDRRKLEDAGHVFMLDDLEDVTHEDIIAAAVVK